MAQLELCELAESLVQLLQQQRHASFAPSTTASALDALGANMGTMRALLPVLPNLGSPPMQPPSVFMSSENSKAALDRVAENAAVVSHQVLQGSSVKHFFSCPCYVMFDMVLLLNSCNNVTLETRCQSLADFLDASLEAVTPLVPLPLEVPSELLRRLQFLGSLHNLA